MKLETLSTCELLHRVKLTLRPRSPMRGGPRLRNLASSEKHGLARTWMDF